jgi:chromosome partitioning protein
VIQTILVLNTKGGCGKSTVATNLASYYAFTGVKCQLLDYDPQGSSLHWLNLRPDHLPRIEGVDATRTRSGLTRTWQMAVPSGTGRLVMDAPAGASNMLLQDMIRRANIVLMPVAPSSIDVHASTTFVNALLRSGLLRRHGVHFGVLGNRVRRQTNHLEALRAVLAKYGVPYITALSDSENYLIAAESGMGIFELDERETVAEREQWQPLLKWLVDPTQEVRQEEPRPRLNVIGAG